MTTSTMRPAAREAAFFYADKLQGLAGVLRRSVGEPDVMVFTAGPRNACAAVEPAAIRAAFTTELCAAVERMRELAQHAARSDDAHYRICATYLRQYTDKLSAKALPEHAEHTRASVLSYAAELDDEALFEMGLADGRIDLLT